MDTNVVGTVRFGNHALDVYSSLDEPYSLHLTLLT